MKETNISNFVRDAVEGGWMHQDGEVDDDLDFLVHNPHSVLLDPLAFQAVGRVRGWEDTWTVHNLRNGDNDPPTWLKRMYLMIDALANGKALEEAVPNE